MISNIEEDQELSYKNLRPNKIKRISTRAFSNARVSKERIDYLWTKVRRVAGVIGKFNKLNKDIRMYGATKSIKEPFDVFDTNSKSIRKKFLFYPTSKFKVIWNMIMVFLTLYTAMIVPYQLSFILYSDTWLYLDGVIDCSFLLDILITFNSVYTDVAGRQITSRKAIAKAYLKSWFLIDIVSSFPLEFFHTSSPENSNKVSYNRFIRIVRVSRIYKMLRMLRILKTLRLFGVSYIETFFTWTRLSTNYARLFIFLIASIISVHVSGCFWYYIAKINDTSPSTWILRNNIDELSNFDKYIVSVYFVFTTLTKIGYGDIYPMNNEEKLFAIFLMGFGAGLYSYIISGLCSFVTNRERIKSDIREKMNCFTEFAKAIKLPYECYDKVKKNIKVNLKGKLHVSLDSTQFLKEIPGNLREEILEYFNKRIVEQIMYFKEKPTYFINQVVPLLKSSVFVFRDIVYEENEAAEEIYFIKSGRVHLKALNKVVFRTYVQGSYFGEIEIIESTPRDSTATIASMEASLLLLRKAEFLQALNDFPEIKEETSAIAKVRKLKQNEGKAHALDLYNIPSQNEGHSLRTESDSSDLSTDEIRNTNLHRKDTAVVVSVQNESLRKKRNRKLWSTVLEKNPKESIFHRTKTMIKKERINARSSSYNLAHSKTVNESKNEMRARYSSYLDGQINKAKEEMVKIEYTPEKDLRENICEKLKLDDVEFSSDGTSEDISEIENFNWNMENVLYGFNARKEDFEDKITMAKYVVNENLSTQKKLKELVWKLGSAIQFRNL